MKLRQAIGAFRVLFAMAFAVTLAASGVRAAPYADMVMDMRTGEVLHATNADSRLHPASLTKMMTLYITFEAIRLGELSLDTMVTVSPHAASEPPSKLGLRAGQKIQLRYLIRAAAVKSANDAATAIGEAVGGSEAAFARRMNRTARALGMTRTTFRNANGLTESGHLSTARDMTILGRHLFYDYPEYYNIFSRRSTDAGGRQVNSTNRRFLDAYRGADGIKTGYTSAAGFNLVASAERGQERIIATVFGGTSTAQRNSRMAELLDLGFSRAPTRVAVNKPGLPRYDNIPTDPGAPIVVARGEEDPDGTAGRVLRLTGAIARSPRPLSRDGAAAPSSEELLAAIQSDVSAAVAAAAASGTSEEGTDEAEEDEIAVAAATQAAAETVAAAAELALAADRTEDTTEEPEEQQLASATVGAPPPRPAGFAEGAPANEAAAETEDGDLTELAQAEVAEETAPATSPIPVLNSGLLVAPASAGGASGADAALAQSLVVAPASTPAPEPEQEVQVALAVPVPPAFPDPVIRPEPTSAEVVSRLSTSGGRHSGVSIGRYPSRYEAEKALISTALSDMSGFGSALRRVVQRGGGFEANFMGMTAEEAERSCQRMEARGNSCTTIGG